MRPGHRTRPTRGLTARAIGIRPTLRTGSLGQTSKTSRRSLVPARRLDADFGTRGSCRVADSRRKKPGPPRSHIHRRRPEPHVPGLRGRSGSSDSSSDRPQLCLSSSWLRLGLLCSSALPGPLPNASEQAKRIAGRDVGDGNGRRPRLGTFSSPDPSGTEMDAGGRLRLGGSTGNPGLPIDASDRRSAVERRGRRSHWLGVRPAMFDVDA
jgi:hypothetical protein